MNEYLLTPIQDNIPAPKHTKIKPRCFTCKKFPVCCLREDYLKTAQLIQNILGDPCKNLLLSPKEQIKVELVSENLKKNSIDVAEENITLLSDDFVIESAAPQDGSIVNDDDTAAQQEVTLQNSIQNDEQQSIVEQNGSVEQTNNCDCKCCAAPDNNIKYCKNYLPYEVNLTNETTGDIIEVFNTDYNEGYIRVYNTEKQYIDFYFYYINGTYKIEDGKEFYYGTKYKMSEESKTQVINGLMEWRKGKIPNGGSGDNSGDNSGGNSGGNSGDNSGGNSGDNSGGNSGGSGDNSGGNSGDNSGGNSGGSDSNPDNPNKPSGELINTTYFSARLECDFYEYQRELTEEESLRRIIAQFPNGIPLKDGTYYHIATFHYENSPVECFNPFNYVPNVAPYPYGVNPNTYAPYQPNQYYYGYSYAPMPYPVYTPPKCNHDHPIRRGDISNANF